MKLKTSMANTLFTKQSATTSWLVLPNFFGEIGAWRKEKLHGDQTVGPRPKICFKVQRWK